ncbi:MAG TPA: DUF305 domain-containing protein [Candidatus Saccharimonadales bacterium]
METKSLLFGLIGFFLGGLLVSTAATLEKRSTQRDSSEVGMSQMADELKDKKGDEYDKAFITNMISHHQAAVDMAKLSEDRAKHEEIKQLSRDIISAQEKEITEMRQWQASWNYSSSVDHNTMSH